MKKSFDVCGLGNGLIDILLSVSDQELARLGLEKGSEQLIDDQTQQRLLAELGNRDSVLASGGSVANSTIAISQLGGRAAFMCRLGDDRYGAHYRSEFEALGIAIDKSAARTEPTGTVLVMIAPDAERTMRANLGAAAQFSEQNVRSDFISQSQWLLIEGYVFANSPVSRDAIKQAIRLARSNQCQVALSISEDFIVHLFGPDLREALKETDLLFANEKEACALTGAGSYREAFLALKGVVPSVVVTAGPAGALIRYEGREYSIAAVPCQPVDLTGAGDMLAGTFLHCLTHGYGPAEAGRAGCHMASQVIVQQGPRLKKEAAAVLREGLATALKPDRND